MLPECEQRDTGTLLDVLLPIPHYAWMRELRAMHSSHYCLLGYERSYTSKTLTLCIFSRYNIPIPKPSVTSVSTLVSVIVIL